MHSAKTRTSAVIAALLIAGSGMLAATGAYAVDPRPGAGTASSPAHSGGPAGGPSARPVQVAAEPQGQVISRLPLSIREEPTARSAFLGSIPPGTILALHCKVVGEDVDGNNLWYLLGNGRPGYVAARYVQNLSPVPWCGVSLGAARGTSSAVRVG